MELAANSTENSRDSLAELLIDKPNPDKKNKLKSKGERYVTISDASEVKSAAEEESHSDQK